MASTTGEEPTTSTVLENSPCMVMEANLMLAPGHEDCQRLKDLLNKDNAAPMVAMMEFRRGKEPSSSVAAAKAQAVAMDARLMVSPGHGECQKLKNLLNKKEAKITMVVTTSSKQTSVAKPALTSSQLRLLATASEGDLKGLELLFGRYVYMEGVPSSYGASGSLQATTADVEEGVNVAAPCAASLLVNCFTEEGDTPLHLVAANGSKGGDIETLETLERCAELIHEKDEDKSLLYKKNNKGDTPLHCAARARNSKMVSCLIRLAKDGKAQDLLRMVNNNNETALHEAVRRFHKQMIKELLRKDPELASFPVEGTSPLYLAIQLEDIKAIILKEDRQAISGGTNDLLKTNEEKSMIQTIHDESKDGSLSYLGPKGQNALHAAVMRGPGLRGAHRRGSVCSVLLEANADPLYQLDNDGLSPIHVAASVGRFQAIGLFLNKCPGSAGLRDAKGRTFLHVAVENKQVGTVYHACRNPSLAWIMNMQDNDGNTALHLAVQAGSLLVFSALLANRDVHVSISNAEGQTPQDIARYKVPPSMLFYNQNSERRIRDALNLVARDGVCRQDHFQKNYQDIHGLNSDYEIKELEHMKDLTQTQSIVSVLIATVAFGATFALPGGYRADDHTNGGTPTLAGRYAFDAFMMANTLAFVFSSSAIICLVRGGSPTFSRHSREIYLGIAFYLIKLSVTCFTAAFAVGVFVVLSPVARKTALAICVMSPLVVLCNNAELWLKWLLLAPSFLLRMGPRWTLYRYMLLVVVNMICQFWPLIITFIWAAYGRAS